MNTKTTHTPGPLTVDLAEYPAGRDRCYSVTMADDSTCTAFCDKDADAFLYAAAPDLLAASKDALLVLEAAEGYIDSLGIIAMLRAAIAKAEGR